MILNYKGKGGTDKTYTEHILKGFERFIEDGKPAFSVVIPPLGRKLIRIIYEQRTREDNERYVQQKLRKYCCPAAEDWQ